MQTLLLLARHCKDCAPSSACFWDMLPYNHRAFCDHARLHSSQQACSKHHSGPYIPTLSSLTELHTSFPCRASAGLQQPVTPGRGRRSAWSGGQPLACNESLQDSGDGFSGLSHSTHLQQNFDDSTTPAVPKKPRTGTVFVCTFTHTDELCGIITHRYIVHVLPHLAQVHYLRLPCPTAHKLSESRR